MQDGLIWAIYGIALVIVLLTLHTRSRYFVPLSYIWAVSIAIDIFTLRELLVAGFSDITHMLLAAMFSAFAAYITARRASDGYKAGGEGSQEGQ